MPKRLLIWLALAAGACVQPHADVVQIWFDPDDGPPTMEIRYGDVGTLWLVVRVGGVAYVCEVLDNYGVPIVTDA